MAHLVGESHSPQIAVSDNSVHSVWSKNDSEIFSCTVLNTRNEPYHIKALVAAVLMASFIQCNAFHFISNGFTTMTFMLLAVTLFPLKGIW